LIVDTHCHLHDAAFTDVRSTLSRANDFDVWGVVAVGCDPTSNLRTLDAAMGHQKLVWPALGFHPEWDQLTDADLEAVEAQIVAHHAHIVAVGEVGLPWYALGAATDAAALITQGRARLNRLLHLATRFDLPVILHAPHAAAAEALDAVRAASVERAVFHWHKGDPDVTDAIVDAGHFISVTPEVVYRDRARELVERVPLDSLLVESDAPWPYQGEFENTPSGPWMAARVAEEVAKIKRLPAEETMYRLTVNACRLFHLVWA
jgi:TatD DNase family protein